MHRLVGQVVVVRAPAVHEQLDRGFAAVELRVVAQLARDLQSGGEPVELIRRGKQITHHLDQAFPGRDFRHPFGILAGQLEEERVLVAEVVEDGAARQPDGLFEPPHGRPLVPVFREAPSGAVEDLTAETVAHRLRHVVGHPMAKAAVEMAVLDAQLRAAGQSFAHYLGGVRATVPSGVSVGIQESIEQTLRVVDGYLDDGYVRIKLKIAPGWDVEPVRAVRAMFGDDVPLQVDARAAHNWDEAH